ncbi:MAG: NfeD family protein [Verrucomicrobia bacterium]|nr:NfeD family protein [Verrucomicrobiota bacterium]
MPGQVSKSRKWSREVIIRYALLQLPELAVVVLALFLIRNWIDVPDWCYIAVPVAFVIKDVVLYHLTWTAYDNSISTNHHRMTGRKGIAVERIAPVGYIEIKGELWKAELADNSVPIEKGSVVCVKDMNGLTLRIIAE